MNEEKLLFYRPPSGKRDYSKDEPMHPLQFAHFRRMTPAEKLDSIAAMWRMSRDIATAGIRMRHPDWNDEELAKAVRDQMLYGTT